MKIDGINCPTCAPFKMTQTRPRSYRFDENQTTVNDEHINTDIITEESSKLQGIDTICDKSDEASCPYCTINFDDGGVSEPCPQQESNRIAHDDSESNSATTSEPFPSEECLPDRSNCIQSRNYSKLNKPFTFNETAYGVLLKPNKVKTNERDLSKLGKTSVNQPLPKIPSPKKVKTNEIKRIEADGNVFLLRRSSPADKINWKKKPRYQVKQTATSKLRHDYWFADCGRHKVKAYRGDWNRFPPELMKDWEVYQNYFKYRRRTLDRRSSVVKKIVRGEITPGSSRRVRHGRIFAKRSPMKLLGGDRPSTKNGRAAARGKRDGLSRASRPGHLKSRRARFDLVKDPLIAVRSTVTSQMRSKMEREPCGKAQTPSFWHGSADEMKELKSRITNRRRLLKEYWRTLMQSGKAVTSMRGTSNAAMFATKNTTANCTDKMSTCMVVSMKPNGEDENKTLNGDLPDAKNVEKLSKVCTNAEATVVRSTATPKVKTSSKMSKTREPVVTPKFRTLRQVAKWMLPPTIPIQQSLTSVMRQKLNVSVR